MIHMDRAIITHLYQHAIMVYQKRYLQRRLFKRMPGNNEGCLSNEK